MLFCDADDYYNTNTIETVIKTIEREKPDLLIYGYSLIKENGKKTIKKENWMKEDIQKIIVSSNT